MPRRLVLTMMGAMNSLASTGIMSATRIYSRLVPSDVVMDLPTWYPFYECMESSPYNQNRSGDYNTTVAIGCAQELDWVWLDWNLLEGCAGGEEGNELMHKVAQATPEHDYVPWVVVDGVTVPDSGEGYPAGNLVEIVCEAYTGDKPDACL